MPGTGSFLGLPRQGISTLSKAAELCESAGNAEDAGYAYCIMEWDHMWLGDLEAVSSLKEKCFAQMDKQFNLRTSVWALNAATWTNAFLGRWSEAEKLGEEACRIAENYADNSNSSWSYFTLCVSHTFKWDLQQAIAYGELAVQKASTPGDMALAITCLAWARCRTGNVGKEPEVIETLIPLFRSSRFVVAELFSTAILGEVFCSEQEHDKAREMLDVHLELQSRRNGRVFLPWAYRLLGEIAVATGSEEGLPHFERSVELAKENKAENELALAYASMGRFYKMQGNMEKTREYLADAVKILERLGALIEPEKVRKELADLPSEG